MTGGTARKAAKVLAALAALAVAVLVAWSAAIGPRAVWRVVTHGTTTVWDHLEYPGRALEPSPEPVPWPRAPAPLDPPAVTIDGADVPLDSALARSGSLAMVVIRDGRLAWEWYADDHGPGTPSMIFSVTKSVLSLMVGAAVDDGLVGSARDPVTAYVPQLKRRGFGAVRLRDLLRMDSGVDYVESDNPFGAHVEFNYTADLAGDILSLRVRRQPDPVFRYKSSDYALLGLALDQALGDRSLTGYLQERLWNPVGATGGGAWSTDREGGLERTWCCLAVTARDLARLGQLVLTGGTWRGRRLLPESWIRASLEPGFGPARWPADYADSQLANYGYGWWLTGAGEAVGLGKDGQYLFVDPARGVVIVRTGEGQDDLSWIPILERVAAAAVAREDGPRERTAADG